MKEPWFFTLEDMAAMHGLALPSARVWCARQVKAGTLVRVRRNLYIPAHQIAPLDQLAWFRLANVIQTPSYISLTTALSYYGVTTQLLPAIVESMNPVRVCRYTVKEMAFPYFYCAPKYYFGFVKQHGVFIAEPEKALLDTLYFLSLGRYTMDHSALDLRQIAWGQIERWAKRYPLRLRRWYATWRKTYETVATT